MKLYAVSFSTYRKPLILSNIRYYYRNSTDMESALFLSYGSKSYLENRTHYVEVENVKSNPLNVQCGSL